MTGALLGSLFHAAAFPPAPDHTIFGQVRNEFGDPIHVVGGKVELVTDSGIRIKTSLVPNLGIAQNYRLSVPMDAGLIAEPYKATALKPDVPFRLSVTLDGVTYLPIEMAADFKSLGLPGRETRIDLTLGEDLDGDGLPDAWERALLKDGQGIADINPNDDADGDGISNLNEYLAGTYAFDSEDGFSLEIAGFNNGAPILKFLALRGRTYSVLGSVDLTSWRDIAFTFPSDGEDALERSAYLSDDVSEMAIRVPKTGGQADCRFFKLMLR